MEKEMKYSLFDAAMEGVYDSGRTWSDVDHIMITIEKDLGGSMIPSRFDMGPAQFMVTGTSVKFTSMDHARSSFSSNGYMGEGHRKITAVIFGEDWSLFYDQKSIFPGWSSEMGLNDIINEQPENRTDIENSIAAMLEYPVTPRSKADFLNLYTGIMDQHNEMRGIPERRQIDTKWIWELKRAANMDDGITAGLSYAEWAKADNLARLNHFYETRIKGHTAKQWEISRKCFDEAYTSWGQDTESHLSYTEHVNKHISDFADKLQLPEAVVKDALALSNDQTFYSDFYKEMYYRRPRDLGISKFEQRDKLFGGLWENEYATVFAKEKAERAGERRFARTTLSMPDFRKEKTTAEARAAKNGENAITKETMQNKNKDNNKSR